MDTTQAAFKSTRRFEKFATTYWPLMRPMFRRGLTPRCRQCTISAKAPGITLTDGVCNKCIERARTPRVVDATGGGPDAAECARLDAILRAHQGKGEGRYDAIVPFSGGKDSTYLLHRLQRDYPKLRLLAGTWDNGFYSPIALATAAAVAKKLDIDHLLFKPAARVYRSLYRYSLQRVGEGGSYAAVDALDGTLNQHIGMTLAAQLRIPLMISGIERAQALTMGGYDTFEFPADRMPGTADQSIVERKSKIKLRDVFTDDDLKLWWDGDAWDFHPKVLVPFVAWHPNHDALKKELADHDLVMPAHLSPLLTNNEVLPIMSAVDIAKIGYCSFEPEFSEMIRGGEGDPAFWRNIFELLEYSVKKGVFLKPAYRATLERLGLTPQQVGLA